MSDPYRTPPPYQTSVTISEVARAIAEFVTSRDGRPSGWTTVEFKAEGEFEPVTDLVTITGGSITLHYGKKP